MPVCFLFDGGGAVRENRIVGAVLLAILTAGLGWYLLGRMWRSPERLLKDAAEAFDRSEYRAVERIGRELMEHTGHSCSGRYLAARALARRGDSEQALELLSGIPDDDAEFGYTARVEAGEILLYQKKQLAGAAECFRRALEIDPHACRIHERLSYIYGIAGLNWRAVPHRVALLCGSQFGPIHLLLLAFGPAATEDSVAIQRFYDADPNDPLAMCGMGLLALRENRKNDARELLERLLKKHEDWVEPQGWYGSLLLEEADNGQFEKWLGTLSATVRGHSAIWHLRGTRARQQQDLRGAVRCFAEAVRSEPNYGAANFQLGQTLVEIGETERAKRFLERARLLETLLGTAKTWEDTANSDQTVIRAAEVCAELGLAWEAWGWERLRSTSVVSAELEVALSNPRDAVEGSAPLDVVLQLYAKARNDGAFTVDADWAIADYPLPEAVASANSSGLSANAETAASNIQFENTAPMVGIDLVYVNGSTPGTAGQYIYNSTGGGVGALDYDLDHWPDLYFTQGCDWPPHRGQSVHLDRMYRNVQGEAFEDVTASARLFDEGFGQGLAVGDIDDDGFPDIYVANIGANRLFRNNGDGTYTDIAEVTNVDGSEWSTSCVIADLNGDSWPDIYTVSYVGDADMFTEPCQGNDGSTRLCTPYEYDAALDRLYLNLGDGRFRDVSSEAGIQVPNGKGLGVVAADFSQSGRIDLFVANDTVPNFFFQNRTSRPGDIPVLDEQSFVTGLAVDGMGQSQACMGVAYGDVNSDGQFDLFVTNFRDESNTLYMQQPGLSFSDASRSADLYDASFALLGFGTQFIDGDLDGRLDLVVSNGHVGDFRHTGVPYHMPTQVFRNVGAEKFVELGAGTLGEFFQQPHLGRGLARLDWNRDGRDDIAVSHLEEPVALLTNRTTTSNQFLALRLRGVVSSRDAVGATVIVTCGQRMVSGQVTSGDGYLARNEQRLTFGLGPADGVDTVEVRWPSGLTQTVQDIPLDTELLLVEGAADPIVLSKTGRN